MADLSERLQYLKETRYLLQRDIASHTGISLRAYRYYESGQRRPDTDTLIKLCNYFDVSADYLLGLSDNPKRN
ncbi:helix-turn-helix domain-containing protein [Paenibacillus larvae]